MSSTVDLHIHSNRSSDGDFSPLHIVRLARENRMRAIAISDHDTMAAYPEALRYGEEQGVEVIPSMELTTLYGDREFHLLLPFVDWTSSVVGELVSEVADRRIQEARERVEKLQALGFPITWKEVVEESGPFPPLGVTIAQILLKKAEKIPDPSLRKYIEGKNRLFAPYEFYKDFFMDGRPASVPRRNVLLVEVLDVVRQTGAVPVLAHPGAYFQRVQKEDLVQLKAAGLQGLEVYTSYHGAEQESYYRDLAEELGLVVTAGSDFHGSIKPHIPFGSLNHGTYEMVEELKKRRP
ncbi:MAG: PHP domain-containing protein [Candidatus Aminicenantales bacterium]